MAVGDYKFYTQPIGNQIAQQVKTISPALGNLILCQTGTLKQLPAPTAFDAILPGVLVLYDTMEIRALNNDPREGSPIRGVNVVYHYEVLYLRRQQANEKSDDILQQNLDLIAALPLPSLNFSGFAPLDGLKITWWIPTGNSQKHPLADILDTPEYRISVGMCSFSVNTNSMPLTS